MTVAAIMAILLGLLVIGAANSYHREQTGVGSPSRNALRRIRRNARKKGISESEAHLRWLNNKSRRSNTLAGYEFNYGADDRPKQRAAVAGSEVEVQHLFAAAEARNWIIRRQRNGLYLIMVRDGVAASAMRNDRTGEISKFTRDELEKLLAS